MRAFHACSLLIAAAGVAVAQNPTVTVVENAASNILPGLPNSGIAQGALFIVKGSNLGPATFAVADKFPFQTSIAGTSVQVTVGGRSVAGIMYYAGATQVAAILPSSTPTGTGTVTVRTGSGTSGTVPITVVQNNLGIFTASQSGAGDAIATLGAGFVTPANAANPGDTVVLWGTGLGPVTFDETNPAQQTDMTNVPLEAYVAGKPAQVLFRGRNACCTAVDTVYIRVPDGVAGCAVPVAFKIGNLISNTTTISIAASGRTCTPTAPGISQTDLNNWITRGSFTAGGIYLGRTAVTTQPLTVGGITIPGVNTRTDFSGASFYKVTVQPGAFGLSSAFDIATYGSCTVTTYSGQSSTAPLTYPIQYLDAGPSIGLSGPGGPKTLAKQTSGANIISYFATLDQNGNYLTAGNYTFTGTGGADVGAFTASLTLPAPLVWTNQSSTTTVDRSKGVTVNWTGGDPAGYVQIIGASYASAGANNTVTTSFLCTAKTTDLTFTVPPVVLLALPPSGSVSSGGVVVPIPGVLSVASISATAPFKAPGVDIAGATSSVNYTNSVTYQ